MNRLSRSSIIVVAVAALSIFLSDCAAPPVMKEPMTGVVLQDGVYEGKYSSWPNKAEVLVTIRDSRIMDIKLTSHWASWIGKKAEVIPQRIIEKQSANVDAVSGATNSSRVIMQAVLDALEKAYAGTLRIKEKE